MSRVASVKGSRDVGTVACWRWQADSARFVYVGDCWRVRRPAARPGREWFTEVRPEKEKRCNGRKIPIDIGVWVKDGRGPLDRVYVARFPKELDEFQEQIAAMGGDDG